MSTLKFRWGATALTLSMGLAAWPSIAQQPPGATTPEASAASATAKSSESDSELSEVVVTARKRSETLQSVPVAITAFGADKQQALGIQTLQDLSDHTPGLSYDSASNRPYIRGVGRNTDNITTASAVAVYFNGVYFGANPSVALQKDSLFVNTIEVDRGPQNTLHGSNADGGTINYVSQKPTTSFYAEARTGVSSYDTRFGEAVVSGPITDQIRFRVGGNYTDATGGFDKNLTGAPQGGLIALGANGSSHYLEAQLEGNFDQVDAWMMVSSAQYTTNRPNGDVTGTYPNDFEVNGSFEPNSFYGLCGLPGVATTAAGAGCAGGPALVPGSVVTAPVTANQFPGNNPGNLNPRRFIEPFNTTQDFTDNVAVAANVTFHAPVVDLVYTGGYQKFAYDLSKATNLSDAGVLSYQLAGPTGAGNLTINPTPSYTVFGEHDASFSHELNIVSTGSSPFQYVAGLYWFHENYEQPTDIGVNPNQPQMYNPQYFNATIPGVFSLGSGGCGPAAGGAIVNLCPAPANNIPGWLVTNTSGTYSDYAAFGQLGYEINNEWRVSGAVRYTQDQKRAEQSFRFTQFAVPGVLGPLGALFGPGTFGAATPNIDVTSLIAGAIPNPLKPGAGMGAITSNPATGFYQVPLDATWSAVTGEADVDWTPDPSTLVYFRYSHGYKSGGFNTLGPISANEQTKSEFVDAYELGAKKMLGRSVTLNGALFYYNYSNDQVPLTVDQSGVLESTIYNMPLVRNIGAEIEGAWRPIPRLELGLNYAFLKATIANAGNCVEDIVDPQAQLPHANTSGCAQVPGSGVVVQNIRGQTVPQAPRNTVSLNAIYTLDFAPGALSLAGSAIWKDVAYGSVFNRDYDKSPSYATLNLRAIWAGINGHYNVIAYCNNVTNTLSQDSAVGQLQAGGTPGTPAIITSQVSLNPPRIFGLELQYRIH